MRRVLYWLMVAVLAYTVVASQRYRFLHPEATETQLFLRLLDALAWR